VIGENMKLYYQSLPKGYLVTSTDQNIARKLKLVFDADSGIFMGKVETLPAEYSCIELEVHKPPPSKLLYIQHLYDKYLQMQKVIEKMHVQVMKTEQKMISFLLKNGLKLKPGAEKDALILSKKHKTRLHYQQYEKMTIHQGILLSLVEEYPELRKCVKTKEVVYVDKRALNKMIKSLDQKVINKITSIQKVYSFMQIKIAKPECEYCGGKLNKENACKKCGS
jgi:hypothetical protein